MTNADRSYTYIARTFDAPSLTPQAFAEAIDSIAMPVWRRLHASGSLASVEGLCKVGDIDMQTSTDPVRDWTYFILLELAPGIDAQDVLDVEHAVGVEAALDAHGSIEYLSSEVLTRPAGAGTAIPLPLSGSIVPPANQRAGIEYIQIPQPYWDEYRQFMREVMGPIGARLVDRGYSYRVQILERRSLLRWHTSLPAWNRVHILWGEFDDPQNGFLKHTTEVIRSYLGSDNDVLSTLARTNHYRVKPRMSKNVRMEALCLNRRS